ncbi:MAG: HD-GYP domain-containing protein, partial [Coriobacteriia bacterium]
TAAAGALVFFIANVLFVGYGSSIISGRPVFEVFREQGFLSYGSSVLVLALLGYVMATLLALESWAGLLLLVLPFALVRRIFRVYLELSEAYTATVRSLVSAIEAKDPYTRGHSERVAVYARRLAEEAGLPATDASLVERAALLHDVGKIGVRLSTLTSPNPLSAGEVREIREHPTIGGDLIQQVEFLSDVVPVIRHHHEHMDGTGYPSGISGEEIPLLSRVLAVADAYDAMTSDRAYRPGMDECEALAELRRVAGSQLDAGMVEHFLAIPSDSSGASD